MKLVVSVALTLILMVSANETVHAARIELGKKFSKPIQIDGCSVILEGPIESGDAETLEQVIVEAFKLSGEPYGNKLCLNSPGGDFREAVEMVEVVRSFGIATYLEENSQCLSGCAFIFMAGTFRSSDFFIPQRSMHASAELGFHAPYLRAENLPQTEFSSKDIVDSYRAALEATQKLIDIFVRPRSHRYHYERELWLKPSLIRVSLAQNSDDFFYVDTVGKAGNFDIPVYGLPKRKQNLEQMIINGCLNTYSWKIDAFGEWEIPVKIFRTEDGSEYYQPESVPAQIRDRFEGNGIQTFYAEIQDGGSGGTMCIFQLHDDNQETLCPGVDGSPDKVNTVWLSDVYFDDIAKFCPSYWQLYDMDHPIGQGAN